MFSVIIPVYNRPDELKELLESISSQIELPNEVIVVEDGSKISSKDVVSTFISKINIRYFEKQNSGPGLARNYGVERASEEWLVFLDSDCTLNTDYFKNLYNHIQRQPEVDVFGGSDRDLPSFTLLQKAINYSMTSFFTTGGIRGNEKHKKDFQPRSFNMGMKRNVFKSVGGFSKQRVGEDIELSLRLKEHGYITSYFSKIGVFHKRRTTLKQFIKQVHSFGKARKIVEKKYPKYTKWVFKVPLLFTVALIFGVIFSIFIHYIFLIPFIIYLTLIFADVFTKNKNLKLAFLTPFVVLIQFVGYGLGYLRGI